MTAITLSKLTLMVCLLLGVLAATTTTVCEAKSLVRGATTPQRKRSSRERQLMKDEDVVPPPDEVADEIAAAAEEDPDTTVDDKEDKIDEVAETEAPTEEPEKEDKVEETEAPTEEPEEEEEVNDKNDKNKDEEPLEEVDEITDAPVVVGAEEGPSDVPMSEQPTEGPAEIEDEETTAPAVGEDEVYTVELSPFSITLEGPTSLMPEDLHIDGYLLEAMQVTMPNLVNITLVGEVTQNGLIVGADATPEVADDANATRTRALRSVPSMHRFLQQLVFYYKGTASFMGPPKYPNDEVNGNMEAALTDTEALTTWVVNSVTFSLGDTGTNTTESPEIVITDVQPNSEVPDSVQKEWEEETAQPSDGLTTTGIAIVSVAAAVGGLSVLIIVFVGLTGSSGVAGKQGLPEQPLN